MAIRNPAKIQKEKQKQHPKHVSINYEPLPSSKKINIQGNNKLRPKKVLLFYFLGQG